MSKINSPEPLAGSFGHMREGLMLLVMAVLVFMIYSNILKAPFVFDDQQNIRDNPHVRLTELTFKGIKEKIVENPYNNRPVAHASFALNYYFHKYNVMGYHLVNILIHIMTGFFLYFFIKITLNITTLSTSCQQPTSGNPQFVTRDPHTGFSNHSLIAFFAVLIWLVHPIQTQSVAYIVQRMNSMAAMFYVLSFLLYAKARLTEKKEKKWVLLAGCVLAGILALGSKEIAATLPFFIFLYEWYFFQDLNRDWFKRHLLLFSGIVILFTIVAVVYMGAHPLERILSDYDKRSFTLTQRVLTEFRVVIYYISLLAFPLPSRLNLDHHFAVSSSLINPVTTIFSIVSVIGLIGLALYMAKRERLLSFCVLWFLGNLVIESSVIGLEIAFEHRTYLPSMLVSMMVATLVCRYVKQKRVILSLLCVVTLVFSYWTYERNKVWGSELSLWEDCIKKSPGKARPHYNLANVLTRQGNIDRAIKHYHKTVLIEHNHVRAHVNLGNSYLEKGNSSDAIKHYSDALLIDPDREGAHIGMGNVLLSLNRFSEALKHYSEVMRINPDSADAYYNMGCVFSQQNMRPKAIEYYSKAVTIDPSLAEAHNNLGYALMHEGKIVEGINHFREAVRLKPDFMEAQKNLKKALTIKEKAVEKTQTLRLKPPTGQRNPAYHYDQGNMYYKMGALESAIDEYEKALSIQPDILPVLNNLALVYVQKKDYAKAASVFGKMISIEPDKADNYYNMACMHALQNNINEAMSWLKKAIEKGYDKWDLIKTDGDLESIRKSSDYRELIQGH
ncbi:MAG: tetratricopeptide repeat protein [Syntrophales bacterium]|nr:tetratricopeptide repeat protein [Syntrophales bacterium]